VSVGPHFVSVARHDVAVRPFEQRSLVPDQLAGSRICVLDNLELGQYPNVYIAQGFFIQMALGTVLYNGCLAFFYLLVIRYGMSPDKIAQTVEPCWMFLLALGSAMGTSVTGIFLELYNPIGWVCTIMSYPHWCIESY
jgi:hypothetical protein